MRQILLAILFGPLSFERISEFPFVSGAANVLILAECALEKACLQRGGPSELSLGRANISTAPWKSINKAQTETYRGSRYKILVEMCPRSGERNNTRRQDPEIKAKWTKQKVEQQETLGKHAFISSNLQQGKV